MVNFDVKIIRGYARDSIAVEYATRGFDDEHHVLVRAVANHAKETRELGLDKAPIERELTAGKGLCRRQCGFGVGRQARLRNG